MKPLLDKKQAAAYLNISERTLDYLRAKGNLPFHIVGGASGKLVRFDEGELRDWILGRTTDTDNKDNKEDEK